MAIHRSTRRDADADRALANRWNQVEGIAAATAGEICHRAIAGEKICQGQAGDRRAEGRRNGNRSGRGRIGCRRGKRDRRRGNAVLPIGGHLGGSGADRVATSYCRERAADRTARNGQDVDVRGGSRHEAAGGNDVEGTTQDDGRSSKAESIKLAGGGAADVQVEHPA